jgi:glycosyltransferase involved in cell wall biosynthesis
VVAHVARSLQSKNRVRAVRIGGALGVRRPGARLLLVGSVDEQEANAIDRQIAGLPEPDSVRRSGPEQNVPALLRRSSALLVTSTREGLPGVVLEALAVGTPVVATPLPGTTFIADLIPGVTLMPLDSPDEEWVDALLAAARVDAQGRAAIAEAFSRSPFLVDRAVVEYRTLWERGLAGRGVGRSLGVMQ